MTDRKLQTTILDELRALRSSFNEHTLLIQLNVSQPWRRKWQS